jgi:glycine/D-amino acid oxidase-like deaminating enzyme
MDQYSDILICGAGIAGVSVAYHLSVSLGVKNVTLVDENAPLSLTSDRSSECYRNWWPGPGNAMVALINRSLDIMELLARESGNIFQLNRRGYLYCTADPLKVQTLIDRSREISKLGAGPLRVFEGRSGDPDYTPVEAEGFENQPSGADLFLDKGLIHKYFPYITEDSAAVLHARRAGWFSAQQLGMLLLEKARSHGVDFINDRVAEVEMEHKRVKSVILESGDRIRTNYFVNAAGPYLKEVGQMVGVELPVYCERHLKATINDHLGVVDRKSPVLIWSDSQSLPWSYEEQRLLSEEQDFNWLLDTFPPGVHTRPEGGQESQIILMIWEYISDPVEPVFPVQLDTQYPEIVLRGLARMLPRFSDYFDNPPRGTIDGGYYTKTYENRPLIGKLPIDGSYVIGALSGFGMMAGCAAGEVLARQIIGKKTPAFANAFNLNRYENSEYKRLLENWSDTGQL